MENRTKLGKSRINEKQSAKKIFSLPDKSRQAIANCAMNKSSFALLLLFACCQGLLAQVFPVTTLVENGRQDNRINLVFLSEGYTKPELPAFIEQAKKFRSDLFAQTPFKQYSPFFNLYAIEVPSPQSGADHPRNANDESSSGNQPLADVDTYFSATFDYGGIHRLLVATNQVAINNVLMRNLPAYDQSFVFVNSPYYGGSGGTHPVASTDASAAEVAIHEIGHSFAGLMDEYFIASQPEAPNRTKNNNPATIVWKNWLGTNDIGIFQYGNDGSNNWYRPHQGCKMQYLGTPFCSVCVEAFLERIYSLVTPIDVVTPAATEVTVSDSLLFSATLIEPDPNTLSSEWHFNTQKVAENTNQLLIKRNQLSPGLNDLTFIVTDNTLLSRTNLPEAGYVFSKTWYLSPDPATAVPHPGKTDKFYYQIFPNPTVDRLTIAGSTDYTTDIAIEILDALGRKTMGTVLRKTSGPYNTQLELGGLAAGTYVVTITLSNGYVVRRNLLKS